MHQNTLLEETKSHFDHWRATRLKRGKIPVHLWDKVKILIDRYPLTAITKSLSLNTNQIRENININTNVHFIEVRPEAIAEQVKQPIIRISADAQICSIELHGTKGCILKINALPVSSLPAIISQFMV